MCHQDLFHKIVTEAQEEGGQSVIVTISAGEGAQAPGPGRAHFDTIIELLDFGVALANCFYPEQKSEVKRYVVSSSSSS